MSDYKAKCFAILGNIRDTGERVAILRSGRPVAAFSRETGDGERSPQTELGETTVTIGEAVRPVLSETHWDSRGQ